MQPVTMGTRTKSGFISKRKYSEIIIENTDPIKNGI